MFGWSIGKNSLLLGAFALVTAAVLAGTFLLTRDQIATAERAAAQRALFEVVPRDRHDNDLLEDTLPAPEAAREQLGLRSPDEIHLARQGDEVVAVIVPAIARDGYSGDIRMIVGINRDGTVAGVRVVAHRETPGLGDKVDLKRDEWILDFDGRSLEDPEPGRWEVKRDGGDFDQFTGATITPRAVVRQVRRTLEFAEDYRALLFPGSEPLDPDASSD